MRTTKTSDASARSIRAVRAGWRGRAFRPCRRSLVVLLGWILLIAAGAGSSDGASSGGESGLSVFQAAASDPGTGTPSAGAGSVALSRFVRMQDAGGVPAGDDGNLGLLIPRLLLEGMRELPVRSTLPAGRGLRLHAAILEGRFLEPGADPGDSGADFIVSGTFSRSGADILVRIRGVSMISGSTKLEWEDSGSPDDLRPLVARALPAILSWLADRPVAWIDVSTRPNAATVSVDGIALPAGTARWFAYAAGDHTVRAEKPGYGPVERQVSLGQPGGMQMELSLQASADPQGPAARALPQAPAWESAAAYPALNDGFRTALGLFAISVPIAVIFAGYNTLYKEAYYRDSSFSDSYSASTIAMGAAISACAALAVNAGIRFVRYIASTR